MANAFLLLFFLSRIFFINVEPLFFDSPEYLTRLADKSFLRAITSGHLPLHAGYVFVFWPIYQISQALGVNPAFSVIVGQIILATIAIYFFYLLIKIISDKTTAFYTAIIVSFVPIFWIANVTIMMETAYVSFFIISAYLLARYASNKVPKIRDLVFAGICLAFSFITHFGIVIYIPFLIYLSFFLNKTRFIKTTTSIIFAIVIASLINACLIAIPNSLNIFQGAVALYTAKLGEHAQFNFDIQSILIYARNFFIPLLRNYTILIVILSLFSLIKMYSSNKKTFSLCFLWIAPSFIANQWWDSVLFGRHSLIAGFGLAFLVAHLVKKSKMAFFILIFLIFYLLIVSWPAMNFLRGEIPYLQEAKTVKQLPKDGLLIESHFTRPQVDKMYKGKIIFVHEPGWQKDELAKEINTLLKNDKPVFVSSQALSEPYGLYSGPYLHSLSLSYRKGFVLKPIIEQFTLKEYKIINKEDNLLIYQVISDLPSPYPKVKIMREHRRRIDYSDPLLFLHNKLKLFRFF